jgi:hypothetical protein
MGRPSEKRRSMPNEFQKKEVTLRSSPGPREGPGTDTVPDLALPARLGVSTDTLPEQAGVYVPPRPLASASDHRTIEIAPVRLAREIDPRRAPTELRLAVPPVRKQGWPLVAVLSALLLLAVGGFFAARFVVAPSTPEEPRAPTPSAPVVAPAPPAPVPTAPPVRVTPLAPVPLATEPEPDLVPVTPDDLVAQPKPAVPRAPAPRESAGAPKKKVRDPWLE